MKSDLNFLRFTFCIYNMKLIFTAVDSEKSFGKIKGLQTVINWNRMNKQEIVKTKTIDF